MLAAANALADRALEWVSARPILAPLACFGIWAIYKIILFAIVDPMMSPLERLPGPPKPGKFFDLRHLYLALDTMQSQRKHQEMREKYGKNMKIQGFGFWDQRLLTFDTRAMFYILVQATELYPKAWQSRRLLSRLLGDGVAITEGEQHKRQRRVINPAFAPHALKKLEPVFQGKANELRDKLLSLSDPTMDINHWISRATFDAFALAGCSYDLQCIQRADHPLYLAYKHMFDLAVNKGQTPLGFMEIYMPWLPKLMWWTKINTQIRKSQAIIEAAGHEMVKEKRDVLFKDEEKNPKDAKDILSLLLKSNMAEASSRNRLSDSELLAQIHSFLFVGSDSVSLSIIWTLYHLSLNPEIQNKLRQSLQAGETEYLDWVVKETLRLSPPVHSTLRVAMRDDMIPTEDGAGVAIRAGQLIHLPFEGMNTMKEVWGDDAWEFQPERFSQPLKATTGPNPTPGLIPGLMSFSVGGHSCPGWQFALMETKAFLKTLVTSLEFLPAPGKRIARVNVVVTRPFVVGEWSKGTQLPMIVRPYSPATQAST